MSIASNFELLTELDRLRKDGTFCDITLKAGGGTISAHKVVLCAGSLYFNAMFTGQFLETKSTEIEIRDIDKDILEILIKYMYTGKFSGDIDELMEPLLLGALFLQISSASEFCLEKIKEGMRTPLSCLKWLIFAGKYDISDIRQEALKKTTQNFDFLFPQDDLLLLEFSEFHEIIRNPTICEYPEDVRYSLVMRWLYRDLDNRSKDLEQLLSHLNPCYIPHTVIINEQTPISILPVINRWIYNYDIANRSLPATQRVLVTKRVSKYNPKLCSLFHRRTKNIAQLPKPICEGSYVGMGYNIYHLGGWLNREVSKTTYYTSLVGRRWMKFLPMLHERAYHRSIAFNDQIYSVGGSTGRHSLQSVEVMDLYKAICLGVAALPQPKEQMGIAIHKNALYSVGGYDRGRPLASMHRFDPRANDLAWDIIITKPHRLGTTSCTVLNDDLYCTHRDCLDRYDIRANKWSLIHTQYNQYPDGVFTLDNTLYGIFKEYIASYVPDEGRWKIEIRFNSHNNYLQVVCGLSDVVIGDVAFPDIPMDVGAGNQSESDDENPDIDGDLSSSSDMEDIDENRDGADEGI